MSEENHWTIDRRVPIALLLGLVVQFGAAVWWASAMDGRVAVIEAQAPRIEAVEAEVQRMQVAAATVNAQLTAVRESLTELKEAQRETNDLLRQYLRDKP